MAYTVVFSGTEPKKSLGYNGSIRWTWKLSAMTLHVAASVGLGMEAAAIPHNACCTSSDVVQERWKRPHREKIKYGLRKLTLGLENEFS